MYGSVQHMIARFGERLLIDLTDRTEPPQDVVDETLIETALVGASSVVDGYLAGRYALPLTSVPEVVTTVTEDIAIYRLYTFERPEAISDNFKSAQAFLRDIAKGVLKLPADAVASVPVSTTGAQILSGDEPYTVSDYKGFI